MSKLEETHRDHLVSTQPYPTFQERDGKKNGREKSLRKRKGAMWVDRRVPKAVK